MNPTYRPVAQSAFLCALLSLLSFKVQAQTYVFGTASYSAPGLSATSPPQGNPPVATADFNGDGIPDAAILGATSGGQVLSIFLGRPDGSFAPRLDYSAQATGFTVGDFNGDGKVDVVIVSYGDLPGASIFLGNGDGTLRPPVPLTQNIGSGYSAAASGDFNGMAS
jgi:FG-GAP-like repeat